MRGTSYELSVDGGSWTPATTPHVHEGLQPGTTYTFAVRGQANGFPGPATKVRATTPFRTVGVCEEAIHTHSNGSKLWTWTTCPATSATFRLFADAAAGEEIRIYSRIFGGQQQYVLGGCGFSTEEYLLSAGWTKGELLGYAKRNQFAGSKQINEWYQDVILPPEGRAQSWRVLPAGTDPGPGGWLKGTYRFDSFGPP